MIKASELLRRARKIHERRTENGTLPGGFYMGICSSIKLAARGVRQERLARVLMGRVQASIKPYAWVSSWLEEKHDVSAPSPYVLTQYRLRWLEALAAEYEAKGD